MIEHALRQLGAVLLATVLAGTQTVAQTRDPVQDEIRAALMKWTADFNARNARDVCDLFAPDLRYDYRGFPERGYQDVCDLLQRSLSDPNKRFSYSADIKEIIVAGDLAVVRLTWTLKVKSNDAPQEISSEEPGLDVFRRQPDGRWKIIRYIAYEAPQ
jgi:uncharacterized protein (TIGR02246 family)